MGLHVLSHLLPLMALQWPPVDSQGNWVQISPRSHNIKWGSWDSSSFPFPFTVWICFQLASYVFWGASVEISRRRRNSRLREPGWKNVNEGTLLRWDGSESINLIRERMAAPELQCIITISTLVFAKCHLYLFSPVSPPWTMSLLKFRQLLIHIVTIMMSHIFPDYISADVTSKLIFTLSSYSLSHTQTVSSIWYICHLVWKTGCAIYSPMHMFCLPNQMVCLLSPGTEIHTSWL